MTHTTQTSLFHDTAATWQSSDDWETPDRIAQYMASLIRPHEHFIVEPSAGTGNISAHLPDGTHCIERNIQRWAIGYKKQPQHHWVCQDYLNFYPDKIMNRGADVVIGNPPFSLWVEFLNHSLQLIRTRGRVLFLGPCDTFHKPSTLKALIAPVVVNPMPIVGRVAYMRDGVAVNGRQIYDSVFEVTLR